jgi:hypothetical protein
MNQVYQNVINTCLKINLLVENKKVRTKERVNILED